MTSYQPPEGDPAAALRPILESGSLARYRLLDVCCPSNHRLAQVINTSPRPVVIFRPGDSQPAFNKRSGERTPHVVSGRWDHLVWWLHPGGHIEVWCPCQHYGQLDLSWVSAQLAEGHRRVIMR